MTVVFTVRLSSVNFFTGKSSNGGVTVAVVRKGALNIFSPLDGFSLRKAVNKGCWFIVTLCVIVIQIKLLGEMRCGIPSE